MMFELKGLFRKVIVFNHLLNVSVRVVMQWS